MQIRSARLGLALAATVGLSAFAAAPVVAADFPAADSGYHTYAEMVAEISPAQAAHPDIVALFSIGKSYQGRDLWVAKVSDNVGDRRARARGPVRWRSITPASTSRSSKPRHPALAHRRLRAPIPGRVHGEHPRGVDRLRGQPGRRRVRPDGHPPIGSGARTASRTRGRPRSGRDLNRNYGYHWACCGGSSGIESPPHVSRAERVLGTRDPRPPRLHASRRIGGRQQIKTRHHVPLGRRAGPLAVRLHEDRRAGDITIDDHAALVAIGKKMAATNGYTPMQIDSLYVTDGDEIDCAYGRERICMYTFELYPAHAQVSSAQRFYPPDEVIGPQTARNREAILYLIERPGAGTSSWEGPGELRAAVRRLRDHRGVGGQPARTDTAPTGVWRRCDPHHHSAPVGSTTSGSRRSSQGPRPGRRPPVRRRRWRDDVRVGSRRAARGDLGALTFRFYLSHGANSTSADCFRAYVGARTAHGRWCGRSGAAERRSAHLDGS